MPLAKINLSLNSSAAKRASNSLNLVNLLSDCAQQLYLLTMDYFGLIDKDLGKLEEKWRNAMQWTIIAKADIAHLQYIRKGTEREDLFDGCFM